MRLRTLPVSVAGVIAGCGYAAAAHRFSLAVSALCMAFAVLAQIASNFANEYFDFRGGLDRKGREGPRRGVTEGDITPRAMLIATLATLGAACAIGLGLVCYGGWWLIAVGTFVAVGVMAYSTGPYPLSHHGLGEVAVILFFGVVPVTLTYWLQVHDWPVQVICASVSIGLMGANVLLVNNYRDIDDDRAVGKRTLTVKIGRVATAGIYLSNGYVAMALMTGTWLSLGWQGWLLAVGYLAAHTLLWRTLVSRSGGALNPLLGITAMLMLMFSVVLTLLIA